MMVLNQERIVLEETTLARLKIARDLEIDPERVAIKYSFVEGKLHPEIDVGHTRDVGPAKVSAVSRRYGMQLVDRLSERLAGNRQKRVALAEEEGPESGEPAAGGAQAAGAEPSEEDEAG